MIADIREIAKTLGGDVTGRNSIVCPGPGHSARDRSLSITFNSDDFTVHSHADDSWQACKDHVRRLLGSGEFRAGERVHRRPWTVIPTALVEQDRTERALSIWREAGSIAGTPAETYLVNRGLHYNGEALRWHSSCRFGKSERHGCIVALVRNIVTNEPQAIHRTAIDATGRKLSNLGSNGRLAYGPTAGGAVKLSDDAEVTKVLAIGEGIETALSIGALFELGNMPVWSVLNAGGIEQFPVLPGIETVWIAADNDQSGTGQKAAKATAEHMTAAGIETVVVQTIHTSTDLNDFVMTRCA